MARFCFCGQRADIDEFCIEHYSIKEVVTNHNGYVYAISCDVTDPISVKVGYSYNPDRRCVDLQAGCPTRLKVMGFISGSQSLERSIHTGLKEYRIRREWFRYEGFAKTIIDLIVAGDSESIRGVVPGCGNISDYERELNKRVLTLPQVAD